MCWTLTQLNKLRWAENARLVQAGVYGNEARMQQWLQIATSNLK